MSREGEVTGTFDDFSAHSGSDPVADPVRDRFYFATRGVLAVGPLGDLDWSFVFGENLAGRFETTVGSSPILGPEGIVYVSSTDGRLYAIDSRSRSAIWTLEVGLDEDRGPRAVGPGIGSVLFVDGTAVHAETGAIGPTPQVDGHPVRPSKVVQGGLVASWFDRSAYRWRLYILDRCFRVLRSLSDANPGWLPEIVGFKGELLMTAPTGYGAGAEPSAAVYSAEGELLVGPKPFDGYPEVLGADNVLYAWSCRHEATGEPALEVRAYDWDLTERWVVDLGPPCRDWRTAALDDQGVLYITRGDPIEIIAIQTTSPGVADTPWPKYGRDNALTFWWAPPTGG